MMPALTEKDALRIAREYYGKTFTQADAVRIVAILIKVGIAGLIQYAYEEGVLDEIGEK